MEKSTGRWGAAIYTPTGRRKRYVPKPESRTLREGRAAAHVLLAELLADNQAGVISSPTLTTGACLRDWTSRRAVATTRIKRRGKVRPATLKAQEMIVRVHIDPVLGRIPLAKLTRRMISDWIDGMHGKPQTIKDRFAVLRAGLGAAVDRGLIRQNPALGVVVPEVPKREPATLDGVEALRLLSGTVGSRWHVLWALGLGTGLRISELLGLGWHDWHGTSLTVSGQLARHDGRWRMVDTKANRSVKRIALPEFTVVALRAHLVLMTAERTPGWTPVGPIITTEEGEPVHASRTLKLLYVELKRLGLPTVTQHELRYSSATLMQDAGVTEGVRMARLGHTTRAMGRHYARGGEPLDRAAAESLNRAVMGSSALTTALKLEPE